MLLLFFQYIFNMAAVQRVVLEGNIGAGKTSLGRLMETLEPGLIKFYPEPVEEWRLEGGAHILDAFYQKIPGAGFLAQTLIGQTLLSRDTAPPPPPMVLGLYERSLLSAPKCFIPALLQTEQLNRTEAEILNRGFAFNGLHWPHLVSPARIVYVRCDPIVCWDRIQARSDVEQGRISLDYLLRLHRLHESWLLGGGGGNVIVADTTLSDMMCLAQALIAQLNAAPLSPPQIFPTED